MKGVLAGHALAGRVRDVPHGFQKDLFECVSAMRQLPYEEVLPPRETPDRVHLGPRWQDDAPAAEPFGNAFGADLRQGLAQMAIVAGDLELDEGAVRAPLFFE